MTNTLNCASPASVPNTDASSAEQSLTRELASAAAAITAYLTQRRIRDERRSTRSVAMAVFFVSLFISFAVTRALARHPDVTKVQTKVGVFKVDHQASPVPLPSMSL
jgi:hypothetical protein